MPQGYFDDEMVEALTALRQRLMADRREELLAEFPIAAAVSKVTNTWHSTAQQLYRNWLLYLAGERKQKLSA